MLNFWVNVSRKLHRYLWVGYVLLAGCITSLILQFFVVSNAQHSNDYAVLSFLGVAWLLLINTIIVTFKGVEVNRQAPTNILKRLKLKIQNAMYYLLALLFVGLTFAIVIMSVRLLRAY